MLFLFYQQFQKISSNLIYFLVSGTPAPQIRSYRFLLALGPDTPGHSTYAFDNPDKAVHSIRTPLIRDQNSTPDSLHASSLWHYHEDNRI